MRTAFIAPSPLLWAYSALSDYHLCLAREIIEYPDYERFYRKMAKRGDYVILDNSAHEMKEATPVKTLVGAARLISPTEVVLPDVLFDSEQTVSRSTNAHDDLKSLGTKLMAVPQGESRDRWEWCCSRLIENCRPDTIGISKDYETWEGGLASLLSWMSLNFPHQEIHMLGWGRDLSAARSFNQYPQVRGIDSAKPLVYAAAQMKLSCSHPKVGQPYPGRPDNYFELDDISPQLARWNLEVFQNVVNNDNFAGLSAAG